MIEVQDIFEEKPVSVKIGDEEFIDPLTHTLAYLHGFAWWRGGMSSHYHPNARQALIQLQPPTIKELEDLTGIHARHSRCRPISPTHPGSGDAPEVDILFLAERYTRLPV
jgi:hypothetical protein